MKDEAKSQNNPKSTGSETIDASSQITTKPDKSSDAIKIDSNENPKKDVIIRRSLVERALDWLTKWIYFGKQGRPSKLESDIPEYETEDDAKFIYDKLYLLYQQEWDIAKSLRSHAIFLWG